MAAHPRGGAICTRAKPTDKREKQESETPAAADAPKTGGIDLLGCPPQHLAQIPGRYPGSRVGWGSTLVRLPVSIKNTVALMNRLHSLTVAGAAPESITPRHDALGTHRTSRLPHGQDRPGAPETPRSVRYLPQFGKRRPPRAPLQSAPQHHPSLATAMSKIEPLIDRVERLLLRHEELQRTNALLTQQLAQITAERDSLRSRLAAARARIDALIDRLPAEVAAAASAAPESPSGSTSPGDRE